MKPIQLTILHTNDMHGRLEPMARLSAFARQLRKEAQAEGRRVFLWDAGDSADRRFQLGSVTKGAGYVPVFNAMGYDLQVMGNDLAITYGPQAYAAITARAAYPVLAANCRDGKAPPPFGLQETARFPLPGGLTLGVVGLAPPYRGRGLYELFGLHAPDPLDVAAALMPRLRQEGAAPVFVVSHLGLDEDRILAKTVPGIDLIVGGHSHSYLPEGEERAGVLIVQAGQYAEALGRVDLEIEPGSGRLLSRTAQVLEVPPDTPPDPLVLSAIAASEGELAALLAQPVGELDAPLDLDYFSECGLGDIAADAVRERMGAQVAVLCSGHFHTGLPAGRVTLGQLDEACFSTGNPGLTHLTGAHFLAALERGLDPAVTRTSPSGFRGAPVGIPQISGLEVRYDPNAPPGAKIRQVLVAGQPLDQEQVYRVASTDAETAPNSGYLAISPDFQDEAQYEVPTILREVIEDYLKHHRPTPEPHMGRWNPNG